MSQKVRQRKGLAPVMPYQKIFESVESEHKAAPEREAEPELCFGESLSQPPLWRSLLDNLRERFFPPKLPPLELTSKPILCRRKGVPSITARGAPDCRWQCTPWPSARSLRFLWPAHGW